MISQFLNKDTKFIYMKGNTFLNQIKIKIQNLFTVNEIHFRTTLNSAFRVTQFVKSKDYSNILNTLPFSVLVENRFASILSIDTGMKAWNF